ncbi:hypothetical protein Tco_0546487 [Tanacetum coccineum]
MEIKKVNEKGFCSTRGSENVKSKGPHYTKDCPLKDEGKTLEEAYCTQFGGPFQGGGYKATALGKDIGSLPSSTETNPRDQVKLISTTIEADSHLIRRIGSSQYAVSTGQNSTLLYKSRQTMIPFPRALMNVPIFVGTFPVMTDFAVLEDMDAYRDEGIGDLDNSTSNVLIPLDSWTSGLLVYELPLSDYDVKGVTTRGGKTTTQDVHDNDTNVLPKEPVVVELEKRVRLNKVLINDQPQITSEHVVQSSNDVQPPPVPFPRRLRKEKDEAQQKKFLENLKQLYINLPFIEALAQMPKYAKFLKGLLTNKARLEEACKIIMNKRCSAVLLNKLPLKEKDLGSFNIPCDIGQLHIDNALGDLGASISLMPYTMYKKLVLGEPKATRMSLELADMSI